MSFLMIIENPVVSVLPPRNRVVGIFILIHYRGSTANNLTHNFFFALLIVLNAVREVSQTGSFAA